MSQHLFHRSVTRTRANELVQVSHRVGLDLFADALLVLEQDLSRCTAWKDGASRIGQWRCTWLSIWSRAHPLGFGWAKSRITDIAVGLAVLEWIHCQHFAVQTRPNHRMVLFHLRSACRLPRLAWRRPRRIEAVQTAGLQKPATLKRLLQCLVRRWTKLSREWIRVLHPIEQGAWRSLTHDTKPFGNHVLVRWQRTSAQWTLNNHRLRLWRPGRYAISTHHTRR